jgi:hypothetical protein
MPLEQDGDIIRMVECPFCDADLRDEAPAEHLKDCEEFQRSAGGTPGSVDVPDTHTDGGEA